jgi:hypothetical protein
MLIHTQWYGTFILKNEGSGWLVVDFKGAEKDSEKIANELLEISQGNILERERDIVKEYEITHLSEERLKSIIPDGELVELWDFEVPHAHEKGYPMTLILQANTLKAEMQKKTK